MPIYEFLCKECSHHFEQMVASMASKTTPACPKCKGPTNKQLSLFAAHSHSSGDPSCQSAQSCQMAQQGSCPGGACPYSQ